MKLSDKINKKTIIYPLNSQVREDALQELLNHFQNNKYLKETKKLFSYLNSDQFKTMARRGVAYHYHTSLEVKETLTATVPVPPPPELIKLLTFTFPSSPFNTLPVLLRGLKP